MLKLVKQFEDSLKGKESHITSMQEPELSLKGACAWFSSNSGSAGFMTRSGVQQESSYVVLKSSMIIKFNSYDRVS